MVIPAAVTRRRARSHIDLSLAQDQVLGAEISSLGQEPASLPKFPCPNACTYTVGHEAEGH